MVTFNNTRYSPIRPAPYGALTAIFDNLCDGPLLAQLWLYRANGRPGYPLRAMWRAYITSFVFNLGSTNELIRALRGNRELRRQCGFMGPLPHRTTFNRFIQRLSRHPELVTACFDRVIEHVRALIPDLGEEVAIDSTTVYVHANPNRRRLADPEAGWTAKNAAGAKEGGKEWRYGYKLHMVADANHGIPLGMKVTPANRNDSPELPLVMEKARASFPWLDPKAAMADRGYDAASNYAYLVAQGTVPIILIRKMPGNQLYDGVYTKEGVPTCIGQVPMQYVRTDPVQGHLYRCVGCHLAARPGVHHCLDETWEQPDKNLRLFGIIPRSSPEWKALYAKRQAVERTFKSLKQSRRLERHCVRGLRMVTLHCLTSVLSYAATVLVTAQSGRWSRIRWMVAKVT